ncbi:MAG: hypothetical protein AABY28_00060 [Candidatus Omnitrophota bacterium]
MEPSGFNPKARWDRHIPETGANNYNPEELNEKIEVLARFVNGKVKPEILIWKNREYRIKKITYSWQERQGLEIISYFSVDTDPNLYQISFNNTSFRWQLDKII